MRSLDAALAYAAIGWQVFPAVVGAKRSHKSAEFSHGRNWGMTTDPEEIRQDWTRWDANVGIATGSGSGIFVLELDTPEGHDIDGFASLRQLESEHGQLPETLQAESPSGSVHHYFSYPTGIEIRNSTSAIAPGIDVRGEGGMVIAPPSVKPGKGIYRWRNLVPVTDGPAWLIELLVAPRHDAEPPPASDRPTTTPERIKAALAAVPADSSRLEWFAVLCGLFKELGNVDGFAVADAWSRTGGGKYKGSRDVRGQWDSIVKAGGYGWTIGTLFWLAGRTNPNWKDDGKAARVMTGRAAAGRHVWLCA